MSINICICGGGGLGHVIAGVAAHKGFKCFRPHPASRAMESIITH